MGFHSNIYEILDRVFLYFPHSTIKTSQIEASKNNNFV